MQLPPTAINELRENFAKWNFAGVRKKFPDWNCEGNWADLVKACDELKKSPLWHEVQATFAHLIDNDFELLDPTDFLLTDPDNDVGEMYYVIPHSEDCPLLLTYNLSSEEFVCKDAKTSVLELEDYGEDAYFVLFHTDTYTLDCYEV